MDINELKRFANMFKPVTSIISVEKKPDGTHGEIRIVTGNDEYLNVITRFKQLGADTDDLPSFIPNSPYYRYFKKDLHFEDYCYRCAVLGETLHTYITPKNMPFWINVTMIPIESDDENFGYCAYAQEYTKSAVVDKMTNVAPDVLAQVLNTCIKLRGKRDFHTTINEVIKDIRDLCDADHCCILLTDFKKRKCSVLCEALSKRTQLRSMKHYVNDAFFDIVETWPGTIDGASCLVASRPQEWEVVKQKNPVWHKSISDAGGHNIVLYPLKNRDEIVGFIWAINFNEAITPWIIEVLNLSTYFIASEIANNELLDQLETMSRVDMLTGVFNRNAMNKRVDEFTSDEYASQMQVGIVFADLNGLKAVNDNQGHHAGDMMLKKAAQVLGEQFPECEIYRAGGDEFMLITTMLDQQALEQRVEKLREAAAEVEGLAFSAGVCVETGSNIRKAMKQADVKMYEDKKRFYELNPDKKRID